MPRLRFNPFTSSLDYVSKPGEGLVRGEVPAGVQDGNNNVFTTTSKFIESSLAVYRNGNRLKVGALNDYTASESGGIGTGFDTITFDSPPLAIDVVIVDYTEK